MAGFTQKQHLVSAKVEGLGDDDLLLTAFAGREELSRPFEYHLDFLSEKDGITAKQVIGKGVGWAVHLGDAEPRWFHGRLRRFVAGPSHIQSLRVYRAEVVPWFWFLQRTSDCRIFQAKTVKQIVEEIFSDHGFTDFQFKLQGSYTAREYCVQYRETAFDFVSRLLEEEGIFYFFRHEESKHTLVLADQTSACQPCDENQVVYYPFERRDGHIQTWDHRYEFRSGAWAHTDYNFKTPAKSLLTSTTTLLDVPKATSYELFDYPGGYDDSGGGDGRAKIRMEEEEAPYEVVEGDSTCCTFSPGATFTLKEHDYASEAGKGYLLAAVEHRAQDTSYTNTDEPADYRNQFHCIPQAVAFRPARLTPRPVVHGPQTAVVVGRSGEEIDTDEYGRVKVQFFWDRKGQKNEKSSCWIRVAENWAGKSWGIVFNPRIGQEVVVSFLEGDPDRPLITGRVYNADQTVPYTLPANQTQSGIKSNSSKGGGGSNELRFEDKKSSEEIYFHAQKDYNRVVENNDTLKVGSNKADDGSQTIEIYKDRTETVKTGDETVTIEQGKRTVTVKLGDDKHEVSMGKRDVIVESDDTHQVKTGNRTVKVDTGNDTHKIAMGNREVTLDMGSDTLTIKLGNQTTKLNLGASSTEALQSVTLKCGQSSLQLTPMGITLKGMTIQIQGQMMTQVKGLMTMVTADAMLQLKGAITMIG
jgi:type VI secretion system secreted protein VgrG